MRRKTTKLLFITGGWLSLALGIAGIPLPLLPTTPFLLLAAFCFAEGSDRLHDWLVNHVHLGPPIRRWREHRAVSRRTKWMGSLSLLAVLAVSLGFGAPLSLHDCGPAGLHQAVLARASDLIDTTDPHDRPSPNALRY